MKSALITLCSILLLVSSCDKENETITPECDTFATVRDMRGLDGCGFIFELSDGTRLEPMRVDCVVLEVGKPVEINPLDNFELVDGAKVKIAYDVMPDYTSFCMVGDVVKIKCITHVEDAPEIQP